MAQKVFALIDCNNFFASCERVFRPDLWDKPVAVLSNNDGCIIARSNEVKAMGVPMGAPLFKFKDVLHAHDTAIFSANFALYGDVSQRISKIMSELAPHIEVYSIDESFVQLSDMHAQDYTAWAEHARSAILRATGVPVSIGIGPTKTLAKAASEYAKQRKAGRVHEVRTELDRLRLLRWLRIEDVWGIGRRLAPKLHGFGVRTAAELVNMSDKVILHEMTIKGLTTVRELRGESIIELEKDNVSRKSIGRSRAFGHTVRVAHQLESAVATFAAQAAAKLRTQQSVCGAVVTYLRARQPEGENGPRHLATLTPLAEPSADTGTIIGAALKGFSKIHDPEFGYKKAGIILLDIVDVRSWQLSLFEANSDPDKKQRLMRAVDSLNKVFGPETVWHATQSLKTAEWQSRHEHRSPAYTTRWTELPVVRL